MDNSFHIFAFSAFSKLTLGAKRAVPRPGLAASRSIDIIEYLALFPHQRYTLSEIARATKINVASCYAILNRLAERGYLSRARDGKAYCLGPSLIAVGEAAYKSDPIVTRAKQVAEELLRELGIPVMLSTAVGSEILAVLSLEDAAGRHPGMWVGERLPLVAPVGAPFLAWASEEEVDAWIARRATTPSVDLVAEWRRDLELTRSRGYQVTMRGRDDRTIASLMSDLASGRANADYKNEVSQLINSYESHKSQPQIIADEQSYEVQLIASPIFDADGAVAYNLCLGGFAQKLSGATIRYHADRLLNACLEIMRAHRTHGRRRDHVRHAVKLPQIDKRPPTPKTAPARAPLRSNARTSRAKRD